MVALCDLALMLCSVPWSAHDTLLHAGGKPWENVSLPLEARVSALLDQLSLEEKLGLLDADKPPTGAIPRLGIPAFEGWTGALCSTCPGQGCHGKHMRA